MFELWKAMLTLSSWYLAGGGVIIAAIATLVYLPAFRQYAIAAIVGTVAILTAYTYGVYNERIVANAKRAADQKATMDAAQSARDRASHAVDRSVCADARDTDCQ